LGVLIIGFGAYEERQLLYRLRQFDKNLAMDCEYRASSKCAIKEETNFPHSIWIRDNKTGEPIAYRFELKGNQYLMLSHLLSRFRQLQKYWVGYEDTKICTELGLIPVYAVNLNKFTILKLWGESARRIFSNRADPFEDEEEYVYWKMRYKKGKLPELSSMNFILKQSADLLPYKGYGCECFRRYFVFGFWCFPEKGFADSTIVLHNSEKVKLVLKACKSIFIPVESYSKKMDLGLEKQLPVEMLTLHGLNYSDDYGYSLQRVTDVAVTKGIIETLKEEKNRGRFLINGIVSEFRKREKRFPTLTSVALYEVSNLDLIMSLIGLVVSQRYNRSKSLSRVGKVTDIIDETEKILRLIFSEVCLDRTFGDSVRDQFSLAISYLKPMIVTDDEDLFFMHPSVYAELLNSGFADRLLSDQNNLVNLLKLLETIRSYSRVEILSSKERDCLKKKGIFVEILLPSLRNAVQQIIISKILKETPILINSEESFQEKPEKFVKKATSPIIRDHEPTVFALTKENQEIFRHLEDYKRSRRQLRRNHY